MTDERLVAIELRLKKLEELIAVLANLPTPPVQKKDLSPREFLLEKQAKSQTQKVVLLGYFLEKYRNMTSFDVADLEGIFRAAKEPLPKNINDLVNKNVSRGLLMEAAERKGHKKCWNLTSSGERFVETEIGH